MESKKIKAAIVGCGVISTAHANAIKSNSDKVELYAVCDNVQEKALKFSEENGVKKYFTDYKKMLEDKEIDLICVCTPSGMHADVEMKITGVVDPDEFRRKKFAKIHNILPENCFETVNELVSSTPIADDVINATMDRRHVETSIPCLKAGYNLLLEKPISTNEKDLMKLLKAVKMGNS